MIREGLALSVFLTAGIALAAGCTGEDPVLTEARDDAALPDASGGGPLADGAADAAASSETGADAQPTVISIAGKLLTSPSGVPQAGLFVPLTGAGASVYIAGKKVPSIGAGGTFSMNDVPVPYDAFVVETNASLGTRVWGYLGLTRPDPMLFGGIGGTALYEGYAAGTLSPAPPGGQFGLIAVGGDGTDGNIDITNTATYAQGHARWASTPPPQVQAAAYTAVFDTVNQLPTFFTSYGVTPPYTPVASATPAMKDILMNMVSSNGVHVTIDLPPTFGIRTRVVSYHPVGGPTFRIPAGDATPTSLELSLPNNASGEMMVQAQPMSMSGADDLVQSVLRPMKMGSQTLTVPAITTRITAPTLGTISAGTPLAWSATPSAAYRFLMFSLSITSAGYSGSSLVVYLNTSSTGAVMPDLTKLGLTLPSGKYTTEIAALGPFSSLDAICGPESGTDLQSYTNAAAITLTAP
jgi:hypothetical protein